MLEIVNEYMPALFKKQFFEEMLVRARELPVEYTQREFRKIPELGWPLKGVTHQAAIETFNFKEGLQLDHYMFSSEREPLLRRGIVLSEPKRNIQVGMCEWETEREYFIHARYHLFWSEDTPIGRVLQDSIYIDARNAITNYMFREVD
jgi:hypothetical protein